MTRRLRYQVAMSLDGFIARPDGSYDWLISDPSIDFGALYKEFDAAVMGRKTYEVGLAAGSDVSCGVTAQGRPSNSEALAARGPDRSLPAIGWLPT